MRWTVGSKIGFGFAMVSVAFLLVGAVSYYSITKLLSTIGWVTHTHQVIELIASIQQGLTDAETGQRGFLLTGQQSYLKPHEEGSATVTRDIDELHALVNDNKGQAAQVAELRKKAETRLATLQEGINIRKKTNSEDAAREWIAAGTGQQQMIAIRELLAKIRAQEDDLLKQRKEEADTTSLITKIIIVVVTLIGVSVSFLIGYLIARGIAKPLREITAAAEAMAVGDLRVQINADHRTDEVGVLAGTFKAMSRSLLDVASIADRIAKGDLTVNVKPQSENDLLGNAFSTMVINLRSLTTQIIEGVNTLSSSTNQISTTTTQLASSAAQTASAVTETTTTVEEVRQTAQVASQKAKYVSDSTQKAAQTSVGGRQSVDATISEIQSIRRQMESIADSMVRLSEQTKTVGGIITTVDDLSAQSNILAVNAAIEAAKAGEQGKGFSVVAQEVRSLAEQSKQATNQVRNILGDIQKATNASVMMTEQGSKAVEVGVKQSSETSQSIQSLASNVTEAAQAATQIAASSQQQLVGMDQVAAAMESIKQASSQNVASAKQLESAAQSLKELGYKLKQLMDRYKL